MVHNSTILTQSQKHDPLEENIEYRLTADHIFVKYWSRPSKV